MQSKCETDIRSLPGCAVIELRGEVDGSAAATLSAAYDAAVAQDQPPCVLLDFAQVDYINSTGIALIVGLLARARAQERPVSACGLSEHYREIFEITRLSDFIELQPDLAAAVGAGAVEQSAG